jgi:thiaminase/transcriptional activator TenA
MPERFTETLRAASEAGWSHAVQHRFVNELFAGAVRDAVMARYLIQDHLFLDSFLVLLGAALASANTFAARLCFGRFIGMVSDGRLRGTDGSNPPPSSGESGANLTLSGTPPINFF